MVPVPPLVSTMPIIMPTDRGISSFEIDIDQTPIEDDSTPKVINTMSPAASTRDDKDTSDNVNVGPKPKRKKIVMLGPHDRYNFGDLLFEKLLTKLLQTRAVAHYRDEDVLRGSIISINMSSHGGPETILSMKRIQD
jgi:hypothetical protein